MKAKITYARPSVLINVQRMTENFYSKRRVNALKTGIKRCSVPDKLLVDNGKEIVPVIEDIQPGCDTMTNEKAINQLEELIEDRKSFCEGSKYNDMIYLKDIAALKRAITALVSGTMTEREHEELEQSLDTALDTIDDMVNEIGGRIIRIAYNNEDFICTCCIDTAKTLFELMKKYAREEDAADIRERWKDITGREIED